MKRDTKPIIANWNVSVGVIARILPIIIVWMLTDIGDNDIMNRPRPKNEVNIIPIIASSLSLERCCKKSIELAASPPATKAPRANGSHNIYAPATPGTIEWLRASPMRDQPFNIKYADRKAHTPPTRELTHMAFIM